MQRKNHDEDGATTDSKRVASLLGMLNRIKGQPCAAASASLNVLLGRITAAVFSLSGA